LMDNPNFLAKYGIIPVLINISFYFSFSAGNQKCQSIGAHLFLNPPFLGR
jgi:hypothetical protein